MVAPILVFIRMDGFHVVRFWPKTKLEGFNKYVYCGSRRLNWWKDVLTEIILSLLDSILGKLYH